MHAVYVINNNALVYKHTYSTMDKANCNYDNKKKSLIFSEIRRNIEVNEYRNTEDGIQLMSK